ncbi:MAG TPA: hypothetical protein VGR37_03785 [Longimicrobiaceae bacterium]|nr:hypothetical protein [Longimicrobiaceae bacterium]
MADVAIAYRIYPRVSRATPVFSEDKLRLAELCLRSFRRSLGSLRVKVWAILDGCPPEYEALFRATFAPEELEIVSLPGVGNAATFERQIEILLGQTESDLVYFCEDDYFYRDGEFAEMIAFLREHPDADFVSPYDHRDYYRLDIHDEPARIRAFGGRHWRTAASTCLTFLTTRRVLRETKEVFRSYCRGNSDAGLWFSLSKHSVRNPLRVLRYLVSDRLNTTIAYHAWRHCAGQLALGRRRSLWIPIPSIATHMDVIHLAPAVDWSGLMRPEVERIAGVDLPAHGARGAAAPQNSLSS